MDDHSRLVCREGDNNASATCFTQYREQSAVSGPHNLEAEQALLGAILFDNRIMPRVEFVRAAHFYDSVHARIFQACVNEISAGRLADSTCLRNRFEQDGGLKEIGGAAYLLTLLEAAAKLSAHAIEYARIVHDLAFRRAVIAAAYEAIDIATSRPDENPLMALEVRLHEIAATQEDVEQSAIDVDGAASSFIDNIDAAGLSTGIPILDQRLSGLYAGEVIILGGRPSMGKTALAAQIARNVAAAAGVVHFASLDMSREQLAARAISAASWSRQYGSERVAYHHLRAGAPNIPRQLLRDLAAELPPQLVIDDRGAQTVSQIEHAARATRRRKKRLDLIVVDYLQLVRGGDRAAGRNNEVAEVSADLKALAKRLSVPLLALSQLSRGTEHRDNKRPSLADLRDSGAIEQDADVVLGVYREAYYLERSEPDASAKAEEWAVWKRKLDVCRRNLEVITLKQRQGPIGADTLLADLAFDVVRDPQGQAA